MYFDKRAAVKGTWRIPERTLLFWAYIGGGIGVKWVQRRFRHKTHKEPFRTLLNGALLFNGMTFIVLMVPSLRDAVADIFAEVVRTVLF